MHLPYGNGGNQRLDAELTAHLAPVRAPESAWARVAAAIEQGDVVRNRDAGSNWVPWRRLAACLLLALGGGAFWYLQNQPPVIPALETAALQAHADLSLHPEQLDLRTSDAARLRKWIAESSPLTAAVATARPQPDPDALELVGARWVVIQGKRMAAVAYRLGAFPATLLIARAQDLSSAHRKRLAPQHLAARRVQAGALELYSWQAGGQVYTLVSSLPEQSQRACMLCHAEPQHRQMILHMKFRS